jgi:hypothetical protein
VPAPPLAPPPPVPASFAPASPALFSPALPATLWPAVPALLTLPPAAAGIFVRSTSVMSVQPAKATSPPREASAKEYLTDRMGITCFSRK